MNLAIRGIDANLGERADESFHRDHFPDLRADFILANPPFNKEDWSSDALPSPLELVELRMQVVT